MKLHLAPIQGVTVSSYRTKHHEIYGGIDTYYAPFISTASETRVGNKLFKDILPEVNEGITLIPQLLGNNGKDFRHYANIITSFGYDEINWNIGCPFPTVAKKKKGSGILPYPEMVRAFLDEALKDDHYDVTVKLRLGYEDLDEGVEIIKTLNKYPLKGIAIHARTGMQKYTGTVDLDAFEVLYKMSDHDVTYNGDIFTVEDFKRIQTRFPDIREFMLGRGLLQNPLLAAEIRGESFTMDERLDKLDQFHLSIFNYYQELLSGERHLLDRMKEFWHYAAVDIDPSRKMLKKIKKTKNLTDYKQLVNQLLAKK